MHASNASIDTAEQELVLTRVFAAPRELVFQAWTEPEHLARWFGPRDSTLPFCKMDVRPGGVLHFCHRFSQADVWVKGAFDEVVEPSRLVFTLGFVDRKGNPGQHPSFPDWPPDARLVTTVTFAEQEGKTKLTLHQIIVAPTPSKAFAVERRMARQGWTESLERLTELLKSGVVVVHYQPATK
jgi:uncharacterized protein YndB with AHSA1/START domain